MPAIFSVRFVCACFALLTFSCTFAWAESFKEALDRGNKALENDDPETAIQAFTLAKSLSPIAANDARIALARLYTKLSRYNEAEVEYQTLLVSTNIRNRDMQREFADFYLQQGKFVNAMNIYSDLLAGEPHDRGSILKMGICLEATGSIDSAKEYYQQVLRQYPDSKEAEEASNRMGRLTQAIDARQNRQFFPVDPEFGVVGLGWWNLKKMPIHIYIDTGNDVHGYRQSMRNSVYRAMDAWRQASGGQITFVLDPEDKQAEEAWEQAIGSTPILQRIEADPTDLPADPVKTGIHVHWVPDLSGAAVGLAWTNVFGKRADETGQKSREVTEGHVWLTTDCLADGKPLPHHDGSSDRIFETQDRLLNEVAIHEFGHALGLMHSSHPQDLMCAGVFAMNSKDVVEARTLSDGDIAALANHYNLYDRKQNAVSSQAVDTTNTDPAQKNTPAAANSAAPARALSGPLAAALADINAHKYSESLAKLSAVLAGEPHNVGALYLRAVTEVLLHKYVEAEKDYRLVIQLAPNTNVARQAEQGLKKLKP